MALKTIEKILSRSAAALLFLSVALSLWGDVFLPLKGTTIEILMDVCRVVAIILIVALILVARKTKKELKAANHHVGGE